MEDSQELLPTETPAEQRTRRFDEIESLILGKEYALNEEFRMNAERRSDHHSERSAPRG